MKFCYLGMVHDKYVVLAFGLGFTVALGHTFKLSSKSCLPCLPYFRVGVPRELLVLSDGLPCVWVDHCCAEVIDVNIMEVLVLPALSICGPGHHVVSILLKVYPIQFTLVG